MFAHSQNSALIYTKVNSEELGTTVVYVTFEVVQPITELHSACILTPTTRLLIGITLANTALFSPVGKKYYATVYMVFV